MTQQDVVAQLKQDITTAEDADDKATADRLRAELAEAQRAAGGGEESRS
ncbi:hypothetical protein [Nocardia suismassiliense]|nr:hypothetical protein [Nocardia suismassiliense]